MTGTRMSAQVKGAFLETAYILQRCALCRKQIKSHPRACAWVQLLSAGGVSPFNRIVPAASLAKPLPGLGLTGTGDLSCENLQFAPKVHRPLRKCLHCCCWLDMKNWIAGCWKQ